ncbi:unnamed protein product [Rhizoctonia solani]|uniref:RING-type domain-containing protein n=1 Tax=Rhizoctonia solani TaxID=456999 RepID=A0A8H3DD91_9AGAM|nr:unnamed protein product [Rhizoctonia solani]
MQNSSNDNSIWEYVHCSVCMVLFLPPNRLDPVPDIPFWLTECGHVICNNHLMADQSCASCGAKNPSIVPLQRNMSSPVSEWFRPVADAHENLVMASRIQHNTFVALIRHYRQKYDTAKIMIKQLQAELASLRGQVGTQGYPAASPRLGPPEQRQVYQSGYASSTSSASKRRRIDMEGVGSSPRSNPTPNRPTRPMMLSSNNNATENYESGGAARTVEYGDQSAGYRSSAVGHQPGTKTLDAKQYTYIPPSTPQRNQPTGNVSGQRIRETLVRHQISRPQSAAVMPPPALDPRRMTARAASTSLSGSNAQGGMNVGSSGKRLDIFRTRWGRVLIAIFSCVYDISDDACRKIWQ